MPITVLKNTATVAGLEPDGKVAIPLSEPACETRSVEIALAGAGGNRSGVWEVSPGRFERQLANAEVMHIVSGRGRFMPVGGEWVSFAAGDTLFFPAHTQGVWDIEEAVRKVYVVMAMA